jgi:hypothetical protein
MKKILPFLLLLALAVLAPATVLGDLAASMQPGSWAELNTNGFTQPLLWAEESYHYITQHSDDAVWNPGTEEVYYIGGGHGGIGKIIVYSAATNTWREETRQPWMEPLGHGYDHNAIDPVNGILYHHPMSGRKIIHRYLINYKTWQVCTYVPDAIAVWELIDCCRGVCYFPEMRSLLITSGRSRALFIFGTFTGKWTKKENLPMADPHTFAKYNPVHKCVMFGGGNGSSSIYKIDSAGNVTSLKGAPFYMGVATTVQTVDPVTGKYLVFHDNGVFYHYDITTDTWSQQSSAVPFFNIGPSGPIFGTVATPVSTYGVSLFMTYNATRPRVHIYKVANTRVEQRVAKTGGLRVEARPNPFNGAVLIRLANGVGANNYLPLPQLAIYDIHGRMVHRAAEPVSGTYTWSASGLPAGIYLLKASVGNKTYSKRLFLQK